MQLFDSLKGMWVQGRLTRGSCDLAQQLRFNRQPDGGLVSRSIFARFHYDGDAGRVQHVLKMAAIEGGSLVTGARMGVGLPVKSYKTSGPCLKALHS